ncbi:MAG: 5'(3')-deoxyribonucleotidase [Niabella sp.]
MKRIAVDMDGVLANCFEQFVKYEQAETGIIKSVNDVLGKKEKEAFEHAEKYLYRPGFFRTLPVMEHSQDVLYKLNKKYEIFIVSSATEFPQSLTEKQEWLNEHFPFIHWKQMVFCGIKTMINADIMIDDHFKNLDHFKGKTILFNQPHNQLADEGRHIRVHNWKEIEQVLPGIEQAAPYPVLAATKVEYAPVISKYA